MMRALLLDWASEALIALAVTLSLFTVVLIGTPGVGL